MSISKENRHSQQDDKGKPKRIMPLDNASVRDLDRIRRKREASSKKRARRRKRYH